LGRKNYLFAGSHKAAKRAAMVYSFFAICKKHEVNPYEWLKYTLGNIMTTNHKNIRDLYPHNYKNNMSLVGRLRLWKTGSISCRYGSIEWLSTMVHRNFFAFIPLLVIGTLRGNVMIYERG